MPSRPDVTRWLEGDRVGWKATVLEKWMLDEVRTGLEARPGYEDRTTPEDVMAVVCDAAMRDLRRQKLVGKPPTADPIAELRRGREAERVREQGGNKKGKANSSSGGDVRDEKGSEAGKPDSASGGEDGDEEDLAFVPDGALDERGMTPPGESSNEGGEAVEGCKWIPLTRADHCGACKSALAVGTRGLFFFVTKIVLGSDCCSAAKETGVPDEGDATRQVKRGLLDRLLGH